MGTGDNKTMSYLVQWRAKSQQDLINRIKSNLDSIKTHFFEIAGYLYEAHTRHLYHGYGNITEFAAENFGFEKTLTYDLIKVFSTFREGDTYLPNNAVTHLNQTQLVALCSCQAGRNTLAAIISPSDTVKDVKRAVKLFNNLSMSKRSTFKAQNLKEFIQEFEKAEEETAENILTENIETFSAQTEKSKSKPMPIRKYVIDVMGEDNTNKFAKLLSEAISNLKTCTELFTVGCSYRYDIQKVKDECMKLINRFYYGTEEQNI